MDLLNHSFVLLNRTSAELELLSETRRGLSAEKRSVDFYSA